MAVAPGSTEPRQHFHFEMEQAWDHIAESCRADFALGEVGSQFVKSHIAASCNREFAVAMTMLSAMAPFVNGAKVAIFPGAPSPINV